MSNYSYGIDYMYVKLAKPRYKVIETTNGAEFVVPSAKNWIYVVIVPFILFGWGILEVTMFEYLFYGVWGMLLYMKFPPDDLLVRIFAIAFLIVFLVWAVWGILVFYQLLWYLVGKEIIGVDQKSLTIAKKVLWFGNTKIYDSQLITDLRIAPKKESIFFRINRDSSPWGRRDGRIKFDYGAKTYSFCEGVDEAEAKMILKDISDRYPDIYNKN